MSRSQPLRVRDYLEHVEQAIERIGEYVSGIDQQGFLADSRSCFDSAPRRLHAGQSRFFLSK